MKDDQCKADDKQFNIRLLLMYSYQVYGNCQKRRSVVRTGILVHHTDAFFIWDKLYI
jgi:hypothetical protein